MAISAGSVKAGRAYVEIFADNSKFDKTLHETEAQFRNWGSQMTQVSGQFLTGVAAYGASLGVAAKLFAEFDESLRTVAATTGNFYGELNDESKHIAEAFLKLDSSSANFVQSVRKSQKAMDDLTSQARRLGRDTSFTAKEAADAMVVLARAGMSVAEIQSTIKDSLNLARATGTDAAETATTVVGILRAFRMEATETQKAVDLLGATVSNSPQNLSDLGSAMKYVGSVSRSLNISLKTTLEDLGTLANFNIRGEQAGTALRNMYLRLTSSLNQRKISETFNVSVVDEQTGNFRRFSDVLTDIKRHVDEVGMSSVEVATHFKDIFGMRSAPAALALMTADVTKMRDALSETNGVVQAMSDEMNFGLSGTIKLLISKFQDLEIAIVNIFSTPLGGFLDRLGKIISWVTDFLEKHRAVIKVFATLALYIGGFTTAFAGLTFAIGLSVKAMSGLLGMVRKMSQVGMGSLVSALKSAFGKIPKAKSPLEIDLQSIDKARESTRYLSENVSTLSKATSVAIERFNRLSTSFERIANHAEGFKKATSTIAESNYSVTQSVKGFADNYGRLSNNLRTARARINSTAGNLINFKARIDSNLPAVEGFTKAINILSTAYEKVGGRILRYTSTLVELIAQSRHAINEVFYNLSVMKELPDVYKAAESALRKLTKTFIRLQSASSKSTTNINAIIKLLQEVNPEVAVEKFSSLAASVRTAGSAMGYLNTNLKEFRTNLKMVRKIGTDAFASMASVIKLAEAYNRLTQNGGFTDADFKGLAQTRIQEMFDLDKQEQLLRIDELQKKLAKNGSGNQASNPNPKPVPMTKQELLDALDELSKKFNEISDQFKNIVNSLNIPVKSLLTAMRNIAKVFKTVNTAGENANASLSSVKGNLTSFFKALESVPEQAKAFRTSIETVLIDIKELSEAAIKIRNSLRNIGKSFSNIQTKTLAGQFKPLSKSLKTVTASIEAIIQLEASFVAGIVRMGDAFTASAVGAQTFADALKSIASSIKSLNPSIGKFNKQTEKSLENITSKGSTATPKPGKESEAKGKPELPEYDASKYSNLKPSARNQIEFVSRSRIRDQASVISNAEARLQAAKDRFDQSITKRDENLAQFKARNRETLEFQEMMRGAVNDLRNAREEVIRTKGTVKAANDELQVFEKGVSRAELRKEARTAQLNMHIDNAQSLIDSNNKQITASETILETLKNSLRTVAKGSAEANEISKKITTVEQTISDLTKSSNTAAEQIRLFTKWQGWINRGAVFEPSKDLGLQYSFFKDSNGQTVTTQGESRFANLVSQGAFPVMPPVASVPPSQPAPTLEEQARQRYEQWLAAQPVPTTPPQTAGQYESKAVRRQDIISDYDALLRSLDKKITTISQKGNNATAEDYANLNGLLNQQIVALREKAMYENLSDEEIGLLRRKSARTYVKSEVNTKQNSDLANLQVARQQVQSLITQLSTTPAKGFAANRNKILISALQNIEDTYNKAIDAVEKIPGPVYKGLTTQQNDLLSFAQKLGSWVQNYKYPKAGPAMRKRMQTVQAKLQSRLTEINTYLQSTEAAALDEAFSSRLESRSALVSAQSKISSLLSQNLKPTEFFDQYKKLGIGDIGPKGSVSKNLSSLQYDTFGNTEEYNRIRRIVKTLALHVGNTITPEIAKNVIQFYNQGSGASGQTNVPAIDDIYKKTYEYIRNTQGNQAAIDAFTNAGNAYKTAPKLSFGTDLAPATGRALWNNIRTGKVDLIDITDNLLPSLKNVPTPYLQGLSVTKDGLISTPFGPTGKEYQYDLKAGAFKGSAKEVFEGNLQNLLNELNSVRATLGKYSSLQSMQSIQSMIKSVNSLETQITTTQQSVAGLSKSSFAWGNLSELDKIREELTSLKARADKTVSSSKIGQAEAFFGGKGKTFTALQNVPKEFWKFIRLGKIGNSSAALTDYDEIKGVAGRVDFAKLAQIQNDPEAMKKLNEAYKTNTRIAYFDKHIKEIDDQLNQQGVSSEREKLLKSLKDELVDQKNAFIAARGKGESGSFKSLSREFLQQIDPAKYAVTAKKSAPEPAFTSKYAKAERLFPGSTFEAALADPANRDLVVKYFADPAQIEATRSYYTSALERAVASSDTANTDYDKAKENLKNLLASSPKYNQKVFERVLATRANDMISQMQSAISTASPSLPKQTLTDMQTFLTSFTQKSISQQNTTAVLDDYAKLFPTQAAKTGSDVLTPTTYRDSEYLAQATFPFLSNKNMQGLEWGPGERERMVRAINNEIAREQAKVAREQTRILLPETLKPMFDPTSTLLTTLDQGVNRKIGKKLDKELTQALGSASKALHSRANITTPQTDIGLVREAYKAARQELKANPQNANMAYTDPETNVTLPLKEMVAFQRMRFREAKKFRDTVLNYETSLDKLGTSDKFSKRGIKKNIARNRNIQDFAETEIAKTQNEIAKRALPINQAEAQQISKIHAQRDRAQAYLDSAVAQRHQAMKDYKDNMAKAAANANDPALQKKYQQDAQQNFQAAKAARVKEKRAQMYFNAYNKTYQSRIDAITSQASEDRAKAIGFLQEQIDRYAQINDAANKNLQLLTAMSKGYTYNTKKGTVTIKGKAGAKMVFAKEMLGQAREAAIKARNAASTERTTAGENLKQSRAALEKFDLEQTAFDEKRAAKKQEIRDQNRMIKKLESKVMSGTATSAEEDAFKSLKERNRTSQAEMREMRMKGGLRTKERQKLATLNENNERTYAQANVNYQAADQNAKQLYRAYSQIFNRGRYERVAILKARKEAWESTKQLGASVNTMFGNLPSMAKNATKAVAGAFKTLGSSAGATVIGLKTASVALRGLARSASFIGGFGKSVLSMLNMQVVMAAVGAITSALTSLWTYHHSSSEERYNTAKEEADQKNSKYTKDIERAESKHEKNKTGIERLKELREKESLSETDLQELEQIKTDLIKNGFSGSLANDLTQTHKKYVEGNAQPVTVLTASDESLKQATRWNDVQEKNQIVDSLANFDDSANWFSAKWYGATNQKDTRRAQLQSDLETVNQQLEALYNNGTPLTETEIQKIEEMLDREFTNNKNYQGGAVWTDKQRSLMGRIREQFNKIKTQNGPNKTYDIGAQQTALKAEKENLSEIREKSSTNPDDIRNAYDNYIASLTTALDKSRKALAESGNKDEIQTAINNMSRELKTTTDEYETYIETLQGKLEEAFPRFGAEKEAYDIVKSGAAGSYALAQAKNQDIDVIDKKYKTKEQSDKNYYGRFYDSLGTLLTEDAIKRQTEEQIKSLDPYAEGYEDRVASIRDEGYRRILELRDANATGLLESTQTKQFKKIENENKKAKEADKKALEDEYQSAIEVNRTETQKFLVQKANEQLASVGGSFSAVTRNAMEIQNKKDAYKGFWDYTAELASYDDQIELQEEILKPVDKQDKNKIKELRKRIKDTKEQIRKRGEKPMETMNEIFDRDKNTGLESTMLYYADKEYASNLVSAQALKREKQKNSAINEIDYDIARYQWVADTSEDSQKVQEALQQIQELNFFRQMADSFYKIEQKMLDIKNQFGYLEFGDKSLFFGQVQTQTTLNKEEEEKLAQFEKEINEQYQRISSDSSLTPEEYMGELSALNAQARLGKDAIKNEYKLKRANQLANGSEDFLNPDEAYRQEQIMQADSKIKKSLMANGIDQRFVAFNEDGTIRALNKDESKELLNTYDSDIASAESALKEAETDRYFAYASGDASYIAMAEQNVKQREEDVKAAKDAKDEAGDTIQRAGRIVQAANAEATANVNSNYLDKMKEYQDTQLDYYDKAYYDQQGSAYDMQIAKMEAMGNTGNPIMDRAVKLQSSQLRYEKAQMEMGQQQQRLATIDQQTELARQNLEQAVANGASEEVQQQLFKKYNQLLGEQQGVRQGMVNTFKEMASIRGDFMKSANATERASAGTFKAVEAGRNAGDWQRENAIKQLNFLKQIAANTGMETDLL